MKLLQSSPVTRIWIARLREVLSNADYRETESYAAFTSLETRRDFAYLNPEKSYIRVFLRLAPGDHADLLPTPENVIWAKRFPSVYTIRTQADLPKAELLLRRSQEVGLDDKQPG
ncbi:MAG TPA: hypothetical protein VKL61_09885 [Candidatus Polarisedimenticolia bacterium]|nr:hypothetical protein [Candidatus Polarisedimenticolia bacterium]